MGKYFNLNKIATFVLHCSPLTW